MHDTIEAMRESGSFVQLDGPDEYAAYFNHLTRVFGALVQWYKHLIDGGETEERLVTGFLSRMLYTVEMLRLKHLYNPARQLHLDLNESGFPHTLAIMELEADLRSKEEKLQTLSPGGVILELMLNEMLEKKRDPEELLGQMAEVQYYNSIDQDKLIMIFTPGPLELKARTDNFRKYLCSWACYDFATNMAYLHLFAFDQDNEEEPLEARAEAFNQFMEVLRIEGSRAPTVGVLASAIDQALPAIHPKVLKRARIGPILSPRFSRDAQPEPMLDFLREFGDPGDFALKVMSEVIISSRQVEEPRRLLSIARARRVREIFAIPETDLRCFNQKASRVYDLIIMPHHVLQQVIGDLRFAEYAAMQRVVYDKEGALHAV